MRLPGQRIVKTTVAVFLTAYICVLLQWPPVFAVITAIVTLEPTVADSIRKGIVRFPASAIGSFYAVLFISIFGNSPITYTLAASLTIITCYQLKLHAGLLVAAITAVAMVEVVIDNYVLSFFIRLGTTTTGIVVSTLVNMFILPPNYSKQINQHLDKIFNYFGEVLLLFQSKQKNSGEIDVLMDKINHLIDKTAELIKYQHSQNEFQVPIMSKKETAQIHETELEQIKLLHYHLTNISVLNFDHLTYSAENLDTIREAIVHLSDSFLGIETEEGTNHEQELRSLLDLFWNTPHSGYKEDEDELPHELTLLYELITIYYVIKQLPLRNTVIQ